MEIVISSCCGVNIYLLQTNIILKDKRNRVKGRHLRNCYKTFEENEVGNMTLCFQGSSLWEIVVILRIVMRTYLIIDQLWVNIFTMTLHFVMSNKNQLQTLGLKQQVVNYSREELVPHIPQPSISQLQKHKDNFNSLYYIIIYCSETFISIYFMTTYSFKF